MYQKKCVKMFEDLKVVEMKKKKKIDVNEQDPLGCYYIIFDCY